MSSGQETRTKSLDEEDAEEIYNVVKNRSFESRLEIKRALGLIWPLEEPCPCGKSVHHLSEFLGRPIRIEGFRVSSIEPRYLEPGVVIKLRQFDGEHEEEHEAYIWSRAILRKLKRLLRDKEYVWAQPWLKLDLEAEE